MKSELSRATARSATHRSDAPPSSSTLRVDEPIGLSAIAEPHVSVVVVRRRDGYAALSAYAARIARSPSLRIEGEAAFEEPGGFDAIETGLANGLPPDDARDALIGDVAYWTEWVTALTGAPRVRVRLIRVASPVFPDFYVDPGTVRLVCTYAGASSEWLDHRDVDGCHVVSAVVPPCAIRQGAIVERCDALDVVLFKGSAWPGAGAIQRAPRTLGARLLLSIEPVWPEPASS
jgi:hypothetical protein